MMLQLPDEISCEVTQFCSLGDELVSTGKLDQAKEAYLKAFDALPENKNNWEAATWIYVAIGDINFKNSDFDRCFKCFYNAVQCPKGLGNPFIHLRLGQMYFEMGDFEKSLDELTRAYMGAGLDILLEDDHKYLSFLENKIEI
nr:hypothetical protein BCU62_18460 [Enterovibrio norvegicus]